MYVPDQQTTTAYRDAIVAMGFAPAHAALVEVDVAQRTSGANADIPLYRITTGIQVRRGSQTVRRALMLWYVQDRTEALEETQDRDAMAAMLVETVSCLPATMRSAMPAIPSWASARAVTVAKTRSRQAA